MGESKPPRRPLTPEEIDRAVGEMVQTFADGLGIGTDEARVLLRAIVSVMRKEGITFEDAIAVLSLPEPPPDRPN